MSTITLGTSATTSLNPALKFLSTDNPADFAALCAAIKNDLNPAHPVMPPSFTHEGRLYIPNRGVLTMLPGDYVGVDSTGWPILVSANAIANGPWTHS
jgi:hypothetical protein